MIKKKDANNNLILYENEYYIEDSGGRPDVIIGWVNKDEIGSLFKTQELMAIIKGIGDGDDKIVNLKEKTKIRLTIEVMNENEKEINY